MNSHTLMLGNITGWKGHPFAVLNSQTQGDGA
jgi:hypothetical protein